MKGNEEKSNGIPLEMMTTAEASLDGLEIFAGLTRKDRTDSQKHGT